MRNTGSLRQLLKANGLEIALLALLIGLLAWIGVRTRPWTSRLVPLPEPGAAQFDGAEAMRHVSAQMAFGPRPTGSKASRLVGDYIIARLEPLGWKVEIQEFTYLGTSARNIIARAGQGPIAILGAHYDTRRQADKDPDPALREQPMPGANDGASGVAVLLELARVLDKERLANDVWLTFFDAEDNGGLDGWEYAAGSSYMAAELKERPELVVVVDMIGDADQQIYQERNSTPELASRIWRIADGLGYGAYFLPEVKWSLIDDHTPFLRRDIPAVDVIDFDYPFWDTTQDTIDKVAPESLERVGRVLQTLLEVR